MSTVPVPSGETAVIHSSLACLCTSKLVAGLEPKRTAIAPRRCPPLIVTSVPPRVEPFFGATHSTDGPGPNTHAAPPLPFSFGPPTSTVSPSSGDIATLVPNRALPVSLAPPSSFLTALQLVPERSYSHAAPRPLSACGAPTTALFPLTDSAALKPNSSSS